MPEVRRERVAILRESAEIGCDGLLLDFCRQPPFLRYHPALANPWHDRHGRDLRTLAWGADREAYLDWCRFRAEFLTAFMRELHQALDGSPRIGRRVPVMIRFPNDGLEANLVAGLDVARWCEEGLVDELGPSELRWLEEFRAFDDAQYLELGRKHGRPVYASCSFNPKQKGQCGLSLGHNPLVLARRALGLCRPGIAGLVFFQSDTGVQLPGYAGLLPRFASREGLESLLADEGLKARFPLREDEADYGIDHHSFLRQFSAGAARAENGA